MEEDEDADREDADEALVIRERDQLGGMAAPAWTEACPVQSDAQRYLIRQLAKRALRLVRLILPARPGSALPARASRLPTSYVLTVTCVPSMYIYLYEV